MNLKKLRALRNINRFNFHQCNKVQNVAEHSFFVALIAVDMMQHDKKFYDTNISHSMKMIQIVYAALLHDVEEAVIGDIGYLIRRKVNLDFLHDEIVKEIGYNVYNEGLNEVKDYIEFADALELKFYLEEERKSGNTGLYQIECETMGRLYRCPIDKNLKDYYIKQVEIVPVKNFPDYLTHEGEI